MRSEEFIRRTVDPRRVGTMQRRVLRWIAIAGLVIGLVSAALPSIALAAPVFPAPESAQASAVAVSINEVDLMWTSSTNSAAADIGVTRDGQYLGSVKSSVSHFEDTTVEAATTYTYVLALQDKKGKTINSIATVTVKTPDQPETTDTFAPSEPEGFEAIAAGDGSVYLDWYAASDDSEITAYRIYRDGSLLITIDSGSLGYIDENIKPGKTYNYTIETIDSSGNQSDLAASQVTLAKTRPPGNKRQVVHGYGSIATDATSQSISTANFTSTTGSTQAVVPGYNSALRRYPYLTDTVAQYATINWATDQSGTTGSAKFGAVSSGSCTPTESVNATRTGMSVNGVAEYQWKAQLTLTPDTEYCYRVYLGSTDLLGSNSSPQFRTQVPTGSNESYSFAVFGDWAQLDSTGANPDMANLMQQISASGARFAVTVGDNGYPSGTQTNYGDLQQTGANTSSVFGPSFWAVPGSSIPIFPAIGNHGFGSSAAYHPQILNFPEDQAVALSGGSYSVTNYCCVNGITPANYPNAWYAFDAGVARFYVLEAAWPDQNVGNANMYQDDRDYHWTISSDEYAWLQQDLASHPRAAKFAFFHFPIYSDNATEPTDPYLQAPGNLQGLLDQFGVNVAFYGHTHTYQRNTPDSAGMVSYLTGGGGAKLEPVGAGSAKCSPNDAYALGWSYSANGGLGGGKSCGSAPVPTSPAQVFHFLLVTVANGTITVSPTDSTGHMFDQMTYSYSTSDSQSPSTPANLTATSNDPHQVDLSWDASSDDTGVTGYTIYRDGNVLTTVDGSTTNFSDMTVIPGTTYVYTVDAFDSTGNHSSQSDPASVTPQADNQPPSVPADLAGQATTALRVNLTWSASTDNIAVTGYDIYRNYTLVAQNLEQTSYVDVLVDPSTSYSYQVLARDDSDNVSALSSPDIVTTPGAVFSDGFESGSVSKWTTTKGLSVEGSAVHAGSYAVEALSNTNNTTGTYAKKTLPSSYSEIYFRSYFEVVSANNQLNLMRVRTSSGTSLGYLYVTTSGTLGLRDDTTSTNTLSSVTVLPGTGWHSLTLHVTINGSASTTEVWFDGAPVSELSLTANWGTTPIGQIQIGDTPGGKVYDVIYDDVAFDPVTGDTQAPTAPTGLTANATQALSVDLTWTASSDNVGVTGYDVYRDGTMLSRNVSQTSFTDVLVDPSTSYSYQVLARDASGNVSALSESSGITTPAPAFFEGFESGTLSAWTTTHGLVIQSTSVHGGTYAAEGAVTGGNSYAKATLPGAYGDFYFRSYINMLTSSSQVNVLRWRDQAGATIGDLYVTAGGHLGLHSDVTSTNISSASSLAAGSGWHVVEIHLVVNGSNSTTQIWLDGVLVPELATTGNWGTAPIGQIQIGDTASGTYDIVYDDVAFAGVAADVAAPSTPANLVVTANGTSEVDLIWVASTDNVGVTGYTIYRDGVVLDTVNGTTTTYSDTSVQPNTSYTYTVDAFDASGNHSLQSSPASYSPTDTTPPTVPDGLATTATALRVDLSWAASADDVGVTGYDIYRDGVLLASVDSAVTSYTDVAVEPSGSYSYQVVADDDAGNASDLSAPSVANTPSAAFSDGFESGGLTAWTSKNGMTVEGTQVHNGSYAVEGLSDANNTTGTYAKKTLSATYMDSYLRASVNIQSIGNNQINMLRLRTASGASIGYLYVTSNGVLGLRNDTTGVNTLSSKIVLPGSGWHVLELHVVVNGPSVTTQVWFDGVLVPEFTLTANWGTTPVGHIQIGDTLTGRTYDVVYDDIAFAGS